jgi:hypothetical protein
MGRVYLTPLASSCHPEDLHDFVAQVVDRLYGDAAGRGLVEGAKGVAVESGPRLLVDLGLERRGLECAVGVVGPEEVGWRTRISPRCSRCR